MRNLLIAVLVSMLASASLIGVADAQTVRTVEQSLSWTDNSDNEAGFIVYLKKGDGSYEEIGRAPANSVSFIVSVTGAVGSKWCYAVSAFNHEFVDGTGVQQESARSNDDCAVILAETQPPPKTPTDLIAEFIRALEALRGAVK